MMALSTKAAHKFAPLPANVDLCGDCYHARGWHTGSVCWVCNQGPPAGVI
jgi:hypothetical protein